MLYLAVYSMVHPNGFLDKEDILDEEVINSLEKWTKYNSPKLLE